MRKQEVWRVNKNVKNEIAKSGAALCDKVLYLLVCSNGRIGSLRQHSKYGGKGAVRWQQH